MMPQPAVKPLDPAQHSTLSREVSGGCYACATCTPTPCQSAVKQLASTAHLQFWLVAAKGDVTAACQDT